MIYLFPSVEGTCIGLHKSKWINSIFLHALEVESWNSCFLCFLRIQASHCFNFLGIVGKPKTPFFLNKRRLIINMAKSSMPQKIRWHYTFIIMIEVWKIMCMSRCLFQLQHSSIFRSGDENHVVRIVPYFNFSTKDTNIVALLLYVHKGHQVPLQLRKIEHIMKKKIQESMQINFDGTHSRRFETWFIYKIHYAIYIVIEVFEEVCSKCHVGGCSCVNKPCISPRRKISVKQIFNYS